jgi:diguanylate cyclase (GGDEF)-like protein/PAS domain S-box-containing protein
MDLERVVDNPEVDAILDTLLMQDPPPWVTALADTGTAVPVPDVVPVAPGKKIERGSSLKLILPDDVHMLVKAWTQCSHTGFAQAVVRLADDPAREVVVHYIDATRRYGVKLGIFSGVPELPRIGPARRLKIGARYASLRNDQFGVVTEIDSAFTEIFGWQPSEFVGNHSISIIHPEDHVRAIANWTAMLRAPGESRRARMRLRHRDGGWIWVEVTNTNRLKDGLSNDVFTELVNVSDEMIGMESLRGNEKLLRRLTDTIPLGIAQIDISRRVVYRNERLTEIVGLSPGSSIEEMLATVAPFDRPILEEALTNVLCGSDVDVELRFRPLGHERRCTVTMRALTVTVGLVSGAIICVTDDTERVRLREALEERATYDALTRCHNRGSILGRLETILDHKPDPGTGTAVIFIDLDGFKAVNDRFGHSKGDDLLRATGACLLAGARTGDLVGRLGGDEFLVVCQSVPDALTALDIAERLARSLRERDVPGLENALLDTSIGVAWTAGESGADALVNQADAAMYQSKREGLGRPVMSGMYTLRPFARSSLST